MQVGSTPTPRSITCFALHLLADFEDAVHLDQSHGCRKQAAGSVKLKAMKVKKLEDEGKTGERGQQKKDWEGGERKSSKCRFFFTEEGCKKGR